MVTFPKYESYKDSGVEWLGEIPSHWKILPFKRLFGLIYRYPTYFGISYVTSGIIEIRGEALSPDGKILKLEDQRYISEKTNRQYPLTVLEMGDVVMSVRGTMGKVGLVDRQFEGANITANLIRLKPRKEIVSGRFLIKFILSRYFIEQLDSISPQTTIKTVTVPKLSQVPIFLPNIDEQERIIEFLDRKTSEIDQAIAQKQRLIELLQEQKAILINQAVTKGLNPNVPMCDSRIEWIGEIPTHWEVCKAKYLFKEVNERSKTGLEELLSVSHLTGVTPRSEKNVSMFMAEDYSGSKLCQKDDLAINIMWAWMGALGVSAQTGIVSPSYGVFRQLKPNTFNSWYLEHLLRSTEYVAEYNRRSTGLHSSRLRLYAHMFLSLEITFPSKEEQDRIETVTIERTRNIDIAINAVEREIKTLEEFRSIIISQAVTGKMKV